MKRKNTSLLGFGCASAGSILFQRFDVALEQNRPRVPAQCAADEVKVRGIRRTIGSLAGADATRYHTFQPNPLVNDDVAGRNARRR